MATEKTWYGGVDFPLPDCSSTTVQAKSMLWTLKAALMGQITWPTAAANGTTPSSAYWTCYGSSSSTAAGMDGVDRWTSTYTPSTIVRQSGGTGPMSWIVLKSPTALGPYYFSIIYASSSDNIALFYLSKNAPTSGSATSQPTYTDKTLDFNASFSGVSAWGNGRAHYCVDAAGNFSFFGSQNTYATIQVSIGVNTLTELRYSGDAWPVVLHVETNNSPGSGALSVVNRAIYANISTPLLRTYSGESSTALNGTILTYDVGSTDYTQDMAAPFYGDGLIEANPCTVYGSSGSAHKGIKGRIPDWRQIGTASGVAPGARYPATGAVQYIVCGTTLVPLGAVPTL